MIYAVMTSRFGEVLIEDDNIKNARRRARRLFQVGPRDVWRVRKYKRCEVCDCAPCCCSHESERRT